MFEKKTTPIIVAEEEKTWCIIKDDILEAPGSNHVEADTKIIMEAAKSDGPVIVKAADTDILALMCIVMKERPTIGSCRLIQKDLSVLIQSKITMGQRFLIYCQHTISSLVVIQHLTQQMSAR